MNKTIYSFGFPDALRGEYEHLAVDAGTTVKLNDMVVRALRLALPVLKAGLTLEQYCVSREQAATADYLECPETNDAD